MTKARCRTGGISLLGLLVSGCGGKQSTLLPAGRGAEDIAGLFWWMLVCGGMVWLAMIALAIYSARTHAQGNDRRVRIWIIGGGAVVPTVLLSGLLGYSLPMLPDLLERQGRAFFEVRPLSIAERPMRL